MNSAKRYLLIALSFAICMTVFATFAPRIAHAVTATLVQVANTSTSPVPVAADGRNVVRLYSSHSLSPGSNGEASVFDDFLTSAPFTVTAGKRLVIETVIMLAYPPSGQKPQVLLDDNAGFGGVNVAIPGVLVSNDPSSGTDIYQNSIAVRDYVEPGNQIAVFVGRNSSAGTMAYTIQAVGHLVDCTNGGGC